MKWLVELIRPKTDPSTGQRKSRKMLAVVLAGAVILALAGVYLVRRHTAHVDAVASVHGAANVKPTIVELETGKGPEEQEEAAQRQAVLAKSLKVSVDELRARNQKPTPAKLAETKVNPARDAGVAPLPAGSSTDLTPAGNDSEGPRSVRAPDQSDGIFAELKAVDTQQQTGVPAAEMQADQEGIGQRYFSLHMRQIAAAANERALEEKGGKGGDAKALEIPEDKMPVMEPLATTGQQGGGGGAAAKTSSGDQSGSGAAAESSQEGAGIPVNILPPFTLPIPAVFMGNFIVVGAGADTAQRVTAYVEQDVYFRNRLQLPRGAMLIGKSAGTRDLDMVDVTFDFIQFPDGTMVPIKGQAYQPFSPEMPDGYLMRGVVGE